MGDIGHSLIIGPSRAGKSVLLNFLAAQHLRYKNAQVFIFDNGRSSLPLCYAMNGSHYDIGGDGNNLTFKPLEHLDGVDFSQAVQWLIDLATINGATIKSKDRTDIITVLNLLKVVTKPEQRTLSYFYFQLLPLNESLSIFYKPYIGIADNFQSRLFNSSTDELTLSNFTVFELERLMRSGDSVLIPTVRYLFNVILRSLDGRPTLIFLEEAWAILKNDVMQSILEEWLRAFAKKNAAIIICTQQISDILNSKISDVLLDQCKTKIFLPNNSLMSNENSRHHYRQLGLNEKQINLISNILPQQHYYFTNQIGNRLFSLGLTDMSLCFLGKTGLDDINLAKELKSKYKDTFGAEWLRHWGHASASEYWLNILKK